MIECDHRLGFDPLIDYRSDLSALTGLSRRQVSAARDLVPPCRPTCATDSLCLPRRLIRFLCQEQKRALICTAIAMCKRTLFLRSSGLGTVGNMLTHSVASEWQLSRRAVSASRRELVTQGIFVREPPPPGWNPTIYTNRYGVRIRYSVSWAPNLRPDNSQSCVKFARPVLNRKPLGNKHPLFRVFDQSDLMDLYADCRSSGKLSTCDFGRIRFLSAAYYACRVGSSPWDLLLWIIRNGRWDRATSYDEDKARETLRAARSET